MILLASADYRGRWTVPVGSIINDQLKACRGCGCDVNVLTVATANGPRVMADDVYDYADEDTTICSDCREPE